MKTLEAIFKGNQGRIIHRHDHVIKVYDEYFSRFRNKPVNVMEIGIARGGSLEMWRDYFGPQCRIFGVDYTNNTDDLQDPQIEIILGDQGDTKFLHTIMESTPPMDIIIDDASHEAERTVVCMGELFGHLNKNGIYAVEDLHCAYRPQYGGGYKNPGTVIEKVKAMVDYFHMQDLPINARDGAPDWINSVYGVHFFRNVLLIDKFQSDGIVTSPLMTGRETVPDEFHVIKGGRFDA